MNDLCAEIEKLGKGIGSASRYRILQALMQGKKTVNELVRAAKLSQPAVSQHLKTLKSCNLVIDQRKGQQVFYQINTEYALGLLKSIVSGIKNH